MNRAFLFCLLLSATASCVLSSTVVLQGGFGYPAGEAASGEPLAEGFEVSVGTFAPGFNPTDAPSDFIALRANWLEYAKTTTAEIDGVPGSFYLKHTNNDPAFAGRPIHLFLLRTTDHAAPAPDASNVTDYGVFTGGGWIFPAVGSDILPPNDLIQINTAQIHSALWGSLDASHLALAFRSGADQSPTAWDAWVASLLGANADPDLRARLSDPSATLPGAPLNNLLSFALDANPLHPSTPPYEVLGQADADGPAIHFTRRSTAGLTVLAEASTDLQDWSLPVTEEIIDSRNGTQTVRVRPTTPTPQAFFRIKATSLSTP